MHSARAVDIDPAKAQARCCAPEVFGAKVGGIVMAFMARMRRGRANRPPPPPLRLAAYRQPGWLSRHRRLALGMMFVLMFFYSALFLLIGRWLIVQFMIPVAILALLIIWALPESQRIPSLWLERFFFAFMAAMLFWPDYLALQLPAMPWITAARLIGLPMVVLLLICLSQSPDFRREMAAKLRANIWLTRLMTVYVVLCVLSIGFSSQPVSSANLLVVGLVNWVAVFLVALYVLSKDANIDRFVRLVWLAVVVWFALGIWEGAVGHVPWAYNIPPFLKVEDELLQTIINGSRRAATGIYRVQGKYTTPLSLAEFMALATPIFIHLAMTAKSRVKRVFAAATLPAIFFVMLATDSRLGVLGFLLAFVIYLFFWSARQWKTVKGSLLGPALSLAYPFIFISFLAATVLIGRLRRLVWGTGAQASSTDSRQAQLEMGWADFIARPWGYGFGRAADTLGYRDLAGRLTIDNYYLSVTLDIGIIGLCVYLAMFLVTIYRGGSRSITDHDEISGWIVPVGVSLINFVIIKSVLSQVEGHAFAFALLGFLAALLARPRSDLRR